jgi:hypothetical protein
MTGALVLPAGARSRAEIKRAGWRPVNTRRSTNAVRRSSLASSYPGWLRTVRPCPRRCRLQPAVAVGAALWERRVAATFDKCLTRCRPFRDPVWHPAPAPLPRTCNCRVWSCRTTGRRGSDTPCCRYSPKLYRRRHWGWEQCAGSWRLVRKIRRLREPQ